MDRPTRKSRTLSAFGIVTVLGLVIAVFTTIGYAGGTAAGQQYGPQNTTRPSISGTARQGSVLTANPGSYNSSSTLSFRYQFRRCDANGDGCGDIAGATSQTYTPTATDVGRRIRVRVTATNSTGSTTTDSDTTAVVAPSTPTTGTIPASAVVLPNRLAVDQVGYSRSPLRSRDAVQMRVRVTDTNGRPVSGALVYVAGVPFSRIQQPPEAQTDASGVATLLIQPTRLLPLRDGFLLTMFVRARKAGDDILAGVSSRRLVSLRTAGPS